jgi:hypothetical protein
MTMWREVSWPFGLIQGCCSAMTATTGDKTVDARFRHLAVFYETGQDYLDQVGEFVRGGLAAREPVLVAVPGARLHMLRPVLDGVADAVTFTDMHDLGRNPARIIPAIRRFTDAHPGRTRFVGEPIWAGRTTAESWRLTRSHTPRVTARCVSGRSRNGWSVKSPTPAASATP